jgi:hypothetical protein
MDQRMSAMLDMADIEFDGKSLNGPSFMASLDSLSAAEAAFSGTYEGYSAWELATHCAYYKYLVAQGLGAGPELEPYPFEKLDFAPLPVPADEAAWIRTRDYLRLAHRVCMDELRASDAARMDSVFAPWKMSFLAAASWLCTHDIYHNAQLRSMGLPGLRRPKEA